MKMIRLFPFVCMMMAVLCGCSPKETNPVLTITGGRILGVPTGIGGVTLYKGIPYAAAPVGDLRWKEPQPVIPWDSIKVCDTFGNIAPQKLTEPGSFYDKEFYATSEYVKNEDCLYLNVWTPVAGDVNAKLPVAMWMHGGALRNGFSHEIEFDGQSWAERGVILVTINYRLGVLGFMAHPELTAESAHNSSGNYGALDQVAALRWIRENIAQFGGDPDKVTIFGQSAGASSVKSLVASPLTKGLIHGAIIQSGGGYSSMDKGTPLDTAELTGEALMRFYGCKSIEEMRAIPADSLGNFENRTQAFMNAEHRMANLSHNLDGYFLKESFSMAADSGNLADIPYMIGGTMEDMRGNSQPIADFSLLREKNGGKVYAYQFARPLPGDDAGAFHSSELWFIFHTLERSWRPFTAGDEALSRYMVDCWTNFAKYGNPNGNGNEVWKPYTMESPAFMLFTTDGSVNTSSMGQPLAPSVKQ